MTHTLIAPSEDFELMHTGRISADEYGRRLAKRVRVDLPHEDRRLLEELDAALRIQPIRRRGLRLSRPRRRG